MTTADSYYIEVVARLYEGLLILLDIEKALARDSEALDEARQTGPEAVSEQPALVA